MLDYKTPVEDILFALEHGAEASRLEAWDGELTRALVTEAGRFVDGVIAPLDPVGDQQPTAIVDGRVLLPDEFVDAYNQYTAAGWPGLIALEDLGGQGLPHVIWEAVSEALSGAGIGFQTILALTQAALRAILAHGTDAQKQRYAPKLASGEWLATMCLSEPQAGSDLGLGRTVATPQDDGSYRLTGSKIFITGADNNLTENIVNLVLARTADAPAGVKGLSLFLCPAVLPDGERNGIEVLRLEDKMGLKVSPTCQLAFDDAWAEIVGGPGEGLARMFTMMNSERLDVGVQGVGMMEVAGQRARAYAAERRQGSGPDSDTVTINRHGDVRCMLLTQIALTEGCRAMNYRTAVDLEFAERRHLVDFMTPVCKAFSSDAAVEVANLAVQVHGGYGFLREYRVEQVLRDARITPIYEGTNGIQAMTLAGRLLRLDNGACPAAFRADMLSVADDTLNAALADWDRATETVANLRDPGAVAVPYLRLSGLLALAAAWNRLEAAAEQAPNPVRIRAAADFTRRVLLPETRVLADIIAAPADLAGLEEGVFA